VAILSRMEDIDHLASTHVMQSEPALLRHYFDVRMKTSAFIAEV
jgi:hypothetical protein